MKTILGNKFDDPTMISNVAVNDFMQAGKNVALTPEEILSERRQFSYEIIEKREQYGKYYAANDGTVTAIFQNHAVHYLDPADNGFKDFDIHLKDLGDILETNVKDLNIKFDKNLSRGNVFELTKKNFAVSLVSQEATTGKGRLNFKLNKLPDRSGNEVILKNVKDNTDFHSVVESDRVKENIIINKKAAGYEYNFDLNIENLTAAMSNDGKNLELRSKQNGETVFYIPAPFMTDANGVSSDLVYYEIESLNEKTLNIKVVASEEWLNAKNRAFPTVINPQIVSAETMLFRFQDMAYLPSANDEDTPILTIRKSLLNVGAEKISKVTLKQYPEMESKNSGYNILDITDAFILAEKDFEIQLKMPGYQRIPGFKIPDFILEVEYLTSDDSVPAKEDFSLAGGANGTLNLNTGEFVTGFTDTSVKKSALACGISHVYKKNSTNYGCGKNWRLNLHQTLVKNTAVNKGVDYIYTDAAGEKHGFIETYYYLDPSNIKYTVDKKDVTVELDGSLWFKSGDESYEVFKDQRTATGMSLSTTMEGFKNIENLEQRHKEQKQTEEYLEAYKNNLKEQVIIEISNNERQDGLIIQNGELKNYFKNDILSSEDFNLFVTFSSYESNTRARMILSKGESNTRARMILSKGEAMQYRSLRLQKEQLVDQIKSLNDQREALANNIDSLYYSKSSLEHNKTSLEHNKTSLEHNRTSLDNNYRSINTQIEMLVCQRKFLEQQWVSRNSNQEPYLIEQIALIGDKGPSHYCSRTRPPENPGGDSADPPQSLNFLSDKATINGNAVDTQIKCLENQIKDLNNQIKDIENQIKIDNQKEDNKGTIQKQKEDIDKQIKDIENQIKDIENQIKIDTQTKDNKGTIQKQKEDIDKQIDNINESIPNTEFQLTAINNQIDYIKNKAAANLKELKRIFKEYTNKEFELKKLKEQIPVSYLSDGNSTLCFNEAGNLCAIYDNYNNFISIEYDNKGRISKVFDGNRAMVLKYNYYGQLVSINDYRGRRITYRYSSTTDTGNLTKATYSDGNTLDFTYKGDTIDSIVSSADKTQTLLSYTSNKLSTITNQSAINVIADDKTVTVSTPITVSVTDINYEANECAITTDEKLSHYFMDRLGNLIGGYVKRIDGTDEERLSFSYFDRTNGWRYLVKETDDPVKLSKGRQVVTLAEGVKTLESAFDAGLYLSTKNPKDISTAAYLQTTALPMKYKEDLLQAFVLDTNSQTSITIPASSLPTGQLEFMFSAYAVAKNPPVTDMRFLTSFNPASTNNYNARFEIVAEVNYKDKTKPVEFVASFDYKNKNKQFCAVPVTLDKSLLQTLQSIVLKHVYTGSGTAAFTDFRFAPCEWEYKNFDQFKNIFYSETGTKLLNKSHSDTYEKGCVYYSFDNEHRVIQKQLRRMTTIGSRDTYSNAVSKYYYNDYGSVVRTEKYIEGEEGTTGIIVEETVYDETGNTAKNVIYNTLDSTAKDYSESEYAENGQLKTTVDATGENKTTIEYAPETDDIQTLTYPDGSKFAYGRDFVTGAVTGITLSSETGESNSTETKYTCGVVTRLKSGLNTVHYEYDAKRRKTKVSLNGEERAKYEYAENTLSEKITVNGIEFNDVVSDKVTAVLKGASSPDIVTEAITDKRGNLIRAAVDGVVQFAESFNARNSLVNSADNITGSTITATYDDDNKRVTSSNKTAGTKPGYENLSAVSESYDYNTYGALSGRTVNVNGTVQTYSFNYKNNANRNLDFITLPNFLLYKPQIDANGRNAGKLLTDFGGNIQFGEYINYRKVGDHTTNMVSSIRYGEVKNGHYVIGDGLSYKYDVCGNISEIWENGSLVAAFTYDKVQRLVREDNMSKERSWFYAYDNNGNILSKKEANYTRKPVDEITAYNYNYKKLYAYDGDRLIDCDGEHFVYDGFGNPTTYRNKVLTWQNCKLTGFGDTTFAYDGFGKRVRKGNVVYTYDIGKQLLQQKSENDILEFIYDGEGLSGVKHGEKQYIYRTNAQGDITHIFDKNGEIVVRYEYDAWGNHTVVDADGNQINSPAHIGNLNPFRYRGYLYDAETNLYFLHNRYYDPEIGRFISQDEVSYLDPGTINGLNLFAYCGNNPVMRIDETGCLSISLSKWGGSVISAAGSVISAAGSLFSAAGNAFASMLGSTIDALGSIAGAAVRFVAGVAVAAIGATITLSILAIAPYALLMPGIGFVAQLGVSLTMYGGFLAASSWDKQIYDDMSAIGWNPFNSNEDAVIGAGKISFYKGVPVFMKSSGRSWSVSVISFNKNEGEKTLRHEWGHSIQTWVLPPAASITMMAIPSNFKLLKGAVGYYNQPWEVTADNFGGVDRSHRNGASALGWGYYGLAFFL